MDAQILRELIQKPLAAIEHILVTERQAEWLATVRAVRRMLDEGGTETQTVQEAVQNAMSCYMEMSASGPGRFSEYYIHRDNTQDRASVNRELDAARDELWRLAGEVE